uniref:Ig-like domain-containing protein n=1 Tax=Myripristis murdjan TaxID=586833 RepID=A0A667WQY6_9TELE
AERLMTSILLAFTPKTCCFMSVSPEEHVVEGGNITFTCKYDGNIYNIQWYRQYPRSRPEFLLYITEGGSVHEAVPGFSAHINKHEKRVSMEIPSTAVTHSALYYCAVRPTVTGNTQSLSPHIHTAGTTVKTTKSMCFTDVASDLRNNRDADKVSILVVRCKCFPLVLLLHIREKIFLSLWVIMCQGSMSSLLITSLSVIRDSDLNINFDIKEVSIIYGILYRLPVSYSVDFETL